MGVHPEVCGACALEAEASQAMPQSAQVKPAQASPSKLECADPTRAVLCVARAAQSIDRGISHSACKGCLLPATRGVKPPASDVAGARISDDTPKSGKAYEHHEDPRGMHHAQNQHLTVMQALAPQLHCSTHRQPNAV